MKAFVMSMIGLAAITVIAAFSLGALDMSAEDVYSSTTGNVRL